MKILAVDIGTGTQDILLLDTNLGVENSYKLILPSPTMVIQKAINKATQNHLPILLSGGLMGGGPSSWAIKKHLEAGFRVFALPEAAQTLNDDLEVVEKLGIVIIDEKETSLLPDNIKSIRMGDFDFKPIQNTFSRFGISTDMISLVVVGVFDHGNAPPGISDRKFRFDYFKERIAEHNDLRAFAFSSENIPPIMTRLRAVARSWKYPSTPLVVMDTAPAAILGSLFDTQVAKRNRKLIVNIGNLHTLAFRMGPMGIEGFFEHHTGSLDREKLDTLLFSLAEGSLTNIDVLNDHGHGALLFEKDPLLLNNPDFNVFVSGPRRNLLLDSSLKPYFVVPFGDMMITGCIGMIAAAGSVLPNLNDEITKGLTQKKTKGIAPWDNPAML